MKPARMPLLLLLATTGGIVISLLAQSFITAMSVMMTSLGLVVVITVLVVLHIFDFQRFQRLLGILALVFSFLGILTVYAAGIPVLSIIWATAAVLCLCGLLHNIITGVLTELQPEAYVESAAGVFLLCVGLTVNIVIGSGVL